VTDLTMQAAETIDSLREQLKEARALVHCGAAEDQRTCSCRRCTQGLAMRMGHRAWAAEERAEKAESALATARREAQEATRALARVLESHADCNDPAMPGTICSACAVAMSVLTRARALASPVSPEAPRESPVQKLSRLVKEAGLTPTLCECWTNHLGAPSQRKPCPCDKCHAPIAASPEAHDETRPDPFVHEK
jgi:hypothetical protein